MRPRRPSHQRPQGAVPDGAGTSCRTPRSFFLFQGKDWTNRLGVAIGALMAALIAGLLIFLVGDLAAGAQVGFLLLLILAPVFLLIGVHPGSGPHHRHALGGDGGRHTAQAGGAGLVLGLLIIRNALIISMGEPWGMQVMFMAAADDRRCSSTGAVPAPVFLGHGRAHAHHPDAGRRASAPTLQRAAVRTATRSGGQGGPVGACGRRSPVLHGRRRIAGGASVATAGRHGRPGQGPAGEDGGARRRAQPSGTRVPIGRGAAPLDTVRAGGWPAQGHRSSVDRGTPAARRHRSTSPARVRRAAHLRPGRAVLPHERGAGWFGRVAPAAAGPPRQLGSGGGSSAAPSSGGRPPAPSSGGRSSAPSSVAGPPLLPRRQVLAAPFRGAGPPRLFGGRPDRWSIFGGGRSRAVRSPVRHEAAPFRIARNGGLRGSSRSGGSILAAARRFERLFRSEAARSGGFFERQRGRGPTGPRRPPLPGCPSGPERGREADDGRGRSGLRPRSKGLRMKRRRHRRDLSSRRWW